MTAQPKVSIIVPVYNAEKYLERCITSLKNQSLSDIEIILVDDASSDLSPEMCDKAAKEDLRIKVIHKENAGAVFLMPENSAYNPILITEKTAFYIFGKVVEVRVSL